MGWLALPAPSHPRIPFNCITSIAIKPLKAWKMLGKLM
jgi:hypothetical protein